MGVEGAGNVAEEEEEVEEEGEGEGEAEPVESIRRAGVRRNHFAKSWAA